MDITVQELKEKINRKENLLIIDVREEWEFEEYNISGKLIPLATLPNHLEELKEYKSKEVIIHCRSGKRSHQAKLFLESNGFENVRNLLGGMLEWQKTL